MNAEYMTKNEMNPTAVKLMEQLATWDKLEGTWEVVIPVTSTVSAHLKVSSTAIITMANPTQPVLTFVTKPQSRGPR